MKGKMGVAPHPQDGGDTLEAEADLGSIETGDTPVFRVGSGKARLVLRLRRSHQLWLAPESLEVNVSLDRWSRQACLRLLSAPGLPLAGHEAPPTSDWLPEPDACMERDELTVPGAAFMAPLTPYGVYAALRHMIEAYHRHALRNRRAELFSRANAQHAHTTAKRLMAAAKALKDPRTGALMGWDQSNATAADYDLMADKLAAVAGHLNWESQRNVEDGGPDLENFIKGPLGEGYERLFGRKPGGNEKGPFPRFGTTFFDLVGQPVAGGTIARALKPRSIRCKV
jgi:hypothetical protein